MKIGDKVKLSPVGPGEVTGFTDRGFPQVNHIACAWGIFEDGSEWGHPDQTTSAAAVRTLSRLGYTYHGAQQWRPPIGPAPVFTADSHTQEPRKDLVPGVMACAKCKFKLCRSNLNLGDGTITAGSSDPEHCPNGCGPMWPVTWEQHCREWQSGYDDLLERMTAAEKDASRWRTLMTLPGATKRIWNHVLGDEHKDHPNVDSVTQAIDRVRAQNES